MKLFPQDNDISLYHTGFDDDVLERKSISKQLSDLVERIEDPIVFALDDKWGSGKTYFLKRWVTAHERENGGNAITVYFDAFANDYLSDPLVAIIMAVSERIPRAQESKFNKLKLAAAKLVKPAFGVALSLATFGAKQQLEEIGDVIVDAVGSETKDAAQQLWDKEIERKDAMKSFKELLAKLTGNDGAPIVIVVDELDRCRPDYALLVLEVIKHFFAVPKVHFILGVNGAALENSVKARYGNEIDAQSYLRKFINVSFSLPRALGPRRDQFVVGRYATHLIAYMSLPEIISNKCVEFLIIVAAHNEVSLRDVGKVVSKIALLPAAALKENLPPGWLDLLCVLLVSSVINPKLHKKLVLASASADDVREFLGATQNKTTETITGQSNPDYKHDLAYWLVLILFCCAPDAALATKDIPSMKSEIGRSFDSFGRPSDPKTIAAQIQRDWVDIFRV